MPVLKSRRTKQDLRNHPAVADEDPQQSVVLGLVAAKIAIAEIEGGMRYGTSADAFAAIRIRLNEMTKDAMAKVRSVT